jgi:hypothetical protein
MEPIKTEEYKGYTIKIIPDEFPESPREWDNLGKMFCSHKRYNFGDEQFNSSQFNGWDEVESYLYKEQNACIVLPLYVYDHSGLSMRTFVHGYHSSWDCGQVGFIYVTKEDVYKEYSCKRISSKTLDKVKNVLESEVKTYSQYLQGDITKLELTNA